MGRKFGNSKNAEESLNRKGKKYKEKVPGENSEPKQGLIPSIKAAKFVSQRKKQRRSPATTEPKEGSNRAFKAVKFRSQIKCLEEKCEI
ncbi:hypothetical protein E1A91_D07G078400v1 [Gossypium mustelinum]|uniref:Uncharacterized protein n=2 Tax=Gossypium TaxID=3633 RepID=A0A5D2U805_GOSMU|nr:hypothetical protein ES288_D07G079600v1 [Gossypium darwinii]TYI72704.1 hypothetical protein E1A91_D07G078400v1 [Gossypium mustelinum]